MVGMNLDQFLSFLRTVAKVVGGGLVVEGYMTQGTETEFLGFALAGLAWLASHWAWSPTPPAPPLVP